MYTQCSKCETVFKLSAEVLRAAGGQVRCGKCGTVFNALARLAEDKATFPGGETALELETRADIILESVTALPIAEVAPQRPEVVRTFDVIGPGTEIAQLEILDFSGAADPELAAENSMEFTLPPGELDRIFVESKKPGVPPTHPESVADIPAPPTAPVAAAAAAADDAITARVNRRTNLAVSDDVRREILSGIEPRTPDFEFIQNRTPPSRALWTVAALAAAFALLAQVVHHNREYLVAHGPLAPLLRSIYSSLGAPVASPVNLSAYQLRQWGVTGDPSADGTLRLRASILNQSPQLEAYPLLRVTLANRFGNKIGTRDFEPIEYLGKPTARALSPGERADATLEILDPGKSAEGFEIDVCLRGGDKKISCANDASPVQTKR